MSLFIQSAQSNEAERTWYAVATKIRLKFQPTFMLSKAQVYFETLVYPLEITIK